MTAAPLAELLRSLGTRESDLAGLEPICPNCARGRRYVPAYPEEGGEFWRCGGRSSTRSSRYAGLPQTTLHRCAGGTLPLARRLVLESPHALRRLLGIEEVGR